MYHLPSLIALLALPLAAQQAPAPTVRVLQPGDLALRAQAAEVLTAARPGAADAALLRESLAKAAALLPTGSAARERADTLLAKPSEADSLRLQLADLAADLTFRPVAEAELPAGVPGYQALDEIELRDYPAYRMVRTDMRGGGMGAFWPLFQHIQKNEIAMTTPVQVDYAADSRRATSMAFLYGSADLGPVGKDGRVEVVDVPAMRVVTIGSRGYDRPNRVAELQTRLSAWLATSTDWQAAGPMRTMSYNSPSVGGDRRYFEVQVPIQKRAAEAPARQDV